MRKLIFSLFALLSVLTLSAQTLKETSTVFPTYQGVVTADVIPSSIYQKALDWAGTFFTGKDDHITPDTLGTNVLEVRSMRIVGQGPSALRAYYTLRIEGRDGRFRYTATITNLVYATHSGSVAAFSAFSKDPQSEKAVQFSDAFRSDLKDWMLQLVAKPAEVDDEW